MEKNKVVRVRGRLEVTLEIEPTTEIPIYSDHSDTHVRRISQNVSRRVIKHAVDLRDGCKIDVLSIPLYCVAKTDSSFARSTRILPLSRYVKSGTSPSGGKLFCGTLTGREIKKSELMN